MKLVLCCVLYLLSNTAFANGCAAFAQHMIGCEPYSCQETNPAWHDGQIERIIEGPQDKVCHYTQRQENPAQTDKIRCNLDPSEQEQLSKGHQAAMGAFFNADALTSTYNAQLSLTNCKVDSHEN